jgi:hypothetical protein
MAPRVNASTKFFTGLALRSLALADSPFAQGFGKGSAFRQGELLADFIFVKPSLQDVRGNLKHLTSPALRMGYKKFYWFARLSESIYAR